ncbi:MAG TPA: APC family permease [Longimicrobiaceae bacterium]|nr:APC family permease [Longimicrobiaceae bacterium]
MHPRTDARPRKESAPATTGGLPRTLGLTDAVGIGFGAVIGAGIFVVTGVAAGVAGPALLVGLGMAGVAAAANALSSAELAARYPHSGGTYEYGYRVLHPWAGFAAGWMFLASKTAAAGTVAVGLAAYLEALAPGLPPRPVAVAAVLLFTALNYLGVRKSARANLLLVGVAVLALLALVVLGAGSLRAGHFRPFTPGGWGGTLQGAALLFFAYTGYARVATLGEEVREPRATIPRAILLTVGGSLLLYLAVAAVAVGLAGAPALAVSPAPLLAAAGALGVPGVDRLVAVGGVAAMLGVLLSQLLGLSRMAFAMARWGDLPRALDRVDGASGVPGRAVLAVGAAAAGVAATGALREIAAAASFAILVYYGIANLAALRMPREAKLYPDVVPAVGLTACALLALALPVRTVLTGCVVLGVGVGVRAALRGGRAGSAL